MKKMMMVLVLMLIFVVPILVSAQSDDCNWLCQVIQWFQGETVTGEA